ncbi:class I SAM-dependent methyltransferase [Roseomonas elaeocarpi]|uniref:Class I SAM-dependent methyltransferase n=1 Tax=Roseomonas elaeocarpi TaxID=907779 RepID=A0ABV6JUJ5_9PROT
MSGGAAATGLLSPATGRVLTQDTPHSLTDGETRWPLVDGIAFLRLGREALAASAIERLDAGDREGALVVLLADQDDWWRGPTAEPEALRRLVREADTLTLRDAMALLSWGPVATYFAHRWSDPTFLAGLALVRAHWAGPATAFELACGIGHHLRALGEQGVRASGGDVVFAKLWVARQWVAPEAELVCFDAGKPWPIAAGSIDLVCCHDAFYFLEPKREILHRLRALRAPGGVLAVSHIHNRDWPNMSAGSAMQAGDVAALFPQATVYDDAELTRALAEERAPVGAPVASLGGVEAFSLAEGPGVGPAQAVTGGIALPAGGAALRRNPLYGEDGTVRWPSERYETEYGPRATYPQHSDAPERGVMDSATRTRALRREMLHLPDRW